MKDAHGTPSEGSEIERTVSNPPSFSTHTVSTRVSRVQIERLLLRKSGFGSLEKFNRLDPSRVSVQRILISRVRVQKFLDPTDSSQYPQNRRAHLSGSH